MNKKPALAICFLAFFGARTLTAEKASFAVVEKVAGRVGFYNAAGARVGEVNVGSFPHEAVFDKATKLLYVSVNGVLWMTEDAKGLNKLAVIDTASMKKVADIDLGEFHRPHGIAQLPRSGNIVATTERPFGLVLVDIKQRKVIRNFDVKGKSPHMVMLSHDGTRAWVSNTDSNSIAVVDLQAGTTKVIATGEKPQGGVLDASGGKLYLTNGGSDRLDIVDTEKSASVGAIATGKQPGRVALTPDGRTLVYNLQGDLAIGFADTQTRKQTGTLDIKGRSLSLTMTRDGKRAYAGVQDQDKVFEIDVPGRKVIRVIDLPKQSGPDPVIPLE